MTEQWKKEDKNQAKGEDVQEKQSKSQIWDQVQWIKGIQGSRNLQGPWCTETNMEVIYWRRDGLLMESHLECLWRGSASKRNKSTDQSLLFASLDQ